MLNNHTGAVLLVGEFTNSIRLVTPNAGTGFADDQELFPSRPPLQNGGHLLLRSRKTLELTTTPMPNAYLRLISHSDEGNLSPIGTDLG